MENIFNGTLNFKTLLKLLPQEGNLVYEYNPFRNYRLDENKFYYKEKFYSIKELAAELGVAPQIINGKELEPEEVLQKQLNETTDPDSLWGDLYSIPKSNYPILYEKGLLVDFDTNELNFSINNPVDILPQYSYDGSVNLILNDGKNPPKLINSRFSPIGKNKYKIYDRKGNNDTNIYDLGSQFDIDTSLYKGINNIPKLSFQGIQYGGNLSIGNYHFYFKYCDADGNESDFVAESGLVSVFIGTLPTSIKSGFRNENSLKLVKFSLKNIDTAYLYVKVYFTRNTSDIYLNETVSAFKIEQNYIVLALRCEITITGFEEVTEIPLTDLNLQYQVCENIKTQTLALNMLFFGNVLKQHIPYEDLADIALRFTPLLVTEEYSLLIDQNYNISSTSYGYYDPEFIYNKVGYWPNELYRFGIVFILANNTLSPVFNVRGGKDVTNEEINWSKHDFIKKSKRNYISHNEENYIIAEDNTSITLENSKGVVSFSENSSKWSILGIKFNINEKPEEKGKVLDYLKNTLKIKGFFFVRQKRIPTTLCLAYTIGIDPESHTPIIPVENNKFIAESFISHGNVISEYPSKSEKKTLTHELSDRLYPLDAGSIKKQAAICPEYDINSPYFNSLFTGLDFTIVSANNTPVENYLNLDQTLSRSFYIRMDSYKSSDRNVTNNVKILGVEDNVKLVAIDSELFSARAGEAEEAFRYEYIDYENKSSDAVNLLRGSFGPYLAITGLNESGTLIDIKIPGYKEANIEDYFKIRYNDKSSYYAISERIDINGIKSTQNWSTDPLYRGDCYICQFTHRINRNFQDPSAPTNDDIVDQNCWKDNYEVTDGVVKKENFENINLGDVNAVLLGLWVTFTVRSNYNLNIRAIDDSIVDEVALFGSGRGFFPYYPICPEGSFKIPESLCFNKGFSKGLSERWNFEVPDVPFLKDEYSNRILYSDIHITDAFRNGFRVFLGNHYRDYPKTYGSITKLIELRGNLLCVFEHGIALIPVNERAVAGEGSGGNIYINTSNVLPENPKVVSDTFGSQWKDSIIKTSRGVYGVDTVGKKIWRTDGEIFECISDFKVLEFLDQNISLTERELEPIIGIRNVKTHYNKFKGDVMFTFYDNLHGFEEKVWNLCWNENLQKWITFYSWVPSYSENIYNQFFSFDRNTSKYISKLGVSTTGSYFADGITLDTPIIDRNGWSTKLTLSNRTLPVGDDIDVKIEFELIRDNYGNYKLFDLDKVKKEGILKFIGNYSDIISELYERDDYGGIKKDDRGRRIYLSNQKNPDKIVRFLNIKANVSVTYKNQNPTVEEAYSLGFTNGVEVDAGYYLSVVAVIPKYNLLFLTTNFWKHGLAGIIDIADKIYPTNWYGKLHPFEFEFVVADNPDKHKIFDNLEIISNKAAPESFHYEIIGECYDFAKDKKNMYIRQEATKELYLFNGSDIEYNNDYKTLDSNPRLIDLLITTKYDKSTIFPLYYRRENTINEIEDYYHLYGHKEMYGKSDKNFSALAGAEIVRYPNLDEYRIWNHAKAVDIYDFLKGGRIRGNMLYKEDIWDVQINPINLVLKNEDLSDWVNVYGDGLKKMVPAECNLFTPPAEVYNKDENNGTITLPPDWERNVISWGISDKVNKEIKLKDKFIKIRIRYSGKDLAVISAIRTLYSISYA